MSQVFPLLGSFFMGTLSLRSPTCASSSAWGTLKSPDIPSESSYSSVKDFHEAFLACPIEDFPAIYVGLPGRILFDGVVRLPGLTGGLDGGLQLPPGRPGRRTIPSERMRPGRPT